MKIMYDSIIQYCYDCVNNVILNSLFFFTDLSPLNDLQYLLILDVSHNKITKMLDFSPPKNLKEVDMSYNEIEEMTDLSAHHYLMKLILDRILSNLI